MKHRMTVEIDDEARTATVIGCSEGIVLQPSGSSYYRIKLKGKPEQIGTISTRHESTCFECGMNHLRIDMMRK